MRWMINLLTYIEYFAKYSSKTTHNDRTLGFTHGNTYTPQIFQFKGENKEMQSVSNMHPNGRRCIP